MERGTPVRALARESSRSEHLERLGVTVQRGSLVDQDDLAQAVRGVDTVFHLGGVVVDDRPEDTSAELWDEIYRVNVEGTERLARAASAAGVRRFVFCSSVRIFGFGNQMLWGEDDPRTPSDLYSKGKALAESALLRVGRETGLEVVSIRPRFIYGNHDRYVLPRLVRQVQRGWVPMVGGGKAICDVVYVRDCVQALLLAAGRPAEAVAGQAFNVTSGECLRLRDIFTAVAGEMRRPVRLVHLPAPAVFGAAGLIEVGARWAGRRPPLSRTRLRWYVHDHHFSIEKARRALGYRPRYRFSTALKEINLEHFVA